jgi:hypothetical protein
MNAYEVRGLLAELIDENPFAIRALLRISTTELSATVPTAAVTCEARPRLLVNLSFVSEHCHTEAQVKAVICHEFLHILLRHTEPVRRARLTSALPGSGRSSPTGSGSPWSVRRSGSAASSGDPAVRARARAPCGGGRRR